MLNSLETHIVSEKKTKISVLSKQCVRGLLDYLESGMPKNDVAEVASMVLHRFKKYTVIGGKYKLPSAA